MKKAALQLAMPPFLLLFFLLRLESMEEEVAAISLYCHFLANSLIQCPLPELLVGIGIPAEALARKHLASEIEDADLLSCETLEGLRTVGWREVTVIGNHGDIEMEVLGITHHKRDVAEGMVFTLAGTSKVGDAMEALGDAEASRLRLVVVLLLAHEMQDVCITALEVGRQRVTVPHDGIRSATMQDMVHARSITTYKILGVMENRQWDRMGRIVPITKNHGIKGA